MKDNVTEIAKAVEHFSRLGALKLQQDQTQKAVEAYRQAYHNAQLLGRNGYMQRACAFNLGSVYISTGSFTDGLAYLKQAEPPKGYKDGKSNGDLYFNCGLAYEGLQNTEEIKRYYSQALVEYQSEHNVKMEADVLTRLGKVYLIHGQYKEALSCLEQLSRAHKQLGDNTKDLQTLAEQASLLLQMDEINEAEAIAHDCFKKCVDKEVSASVANVLIELSLTYTQMRNYDQALHCCRTALPAINTQTSDLKQMAVLYQNLGVIHNYLGQYEHAIVYHERAASKYAEINNRKSQGHCFINLGYAYSQLKNIDLAGEYFLHSLQAAKDCGDRKSEWQSLEALGSVSYHHGNIKNCLAYYRAALAVLAKSPDADDTVVQNRLLEKLTNVVQLEGQKADKPVSFTQQGELQSGTSIEADDNAVKSARSTKRRVIALKKGTKIKYLRVRRSGTLLRFNKIAHGLDPSMSPQPTARQLSLGLDLDDDVFSASTIGTSDEENFEDPESEKVDRAVHQNRHSENVLTTYSEEGEEDEETENDDEEEKEKLKVFDALRNVASYEDEGTMPMQAEAGAAKLLETESDDVHSEQHTQSKTDSPSEDDEKTDASSSFESTDDEENDERKHRSDKQDVPPKIPMMLPQSTNLKTLRTYEIPVGEHELRQSAGSSQSKESVRKGQGIYSSLANSKDEDGINFFHSENERSFINKQAATFESKKETGKEEFGINNTIYETIRPTTPREHNAKNVDSSGSDYDTESELTAHESLPKGERDKIEYKAFHKDLKARRAAEVKPEDVITSKKSSRVCIVM